MLAKLGAQMKELETKLAEGLARESAQREELQREMERRFQAAEAALLGNVRMVLLILHVRRFTISSRQRAFTKKPLPRDGWKVQRPRPTSWSPMHQGSAHV